MTELILCMVHGDGVGKVGWMQIVLSREAKEFGHFIGSRKATE